MIPSTLLGLVVFAASLGPGYIFAVVAEQRHPRHVRSQLLELAELLVVGAFTSAVAALIVLTVADKAGWIDTKRLSKHAIPYLVEEPYRGLGLFLATLMLSCLAAAGAAYALYGKATSKYERASMWHALFKTANAQNLAFTTVELEDGRLVGGYLYGYEALPASPDESYLTLRAPLFAKRSWDALDEPLVDHFIVLRADQIKYAAVRFHAPGVKV